MSQKWGYLRPDQPRCFSLPLCQPLASVGTLIALPLTWRTVQRLTPKKESQL